MGRSKMHKKAGASSPMRQRSFEVKDIAGTSPKSPESPNTLGGDEKPEMTEREFNDLCVAAKAQGLIPDKNGWKKVAGMVVGFVLAFGALAMMTGGVDPGAATNGSGLKILGWGKKPEQEKTEQEKEAELEAATKAWDDVFKPEDTSNPAPAKTHKKLWYLKKLHHGLLKRPVLYSKFNVLYDHRKTLIQGGRLKKVSDGKSLNLGVMLNPSILFVECSGFGSFFPLLKPTNFVEFDFPPSQDSGDATGEPEVRLRWLSHTPPVTQEEIVRPLSSITTFQKKVSSWTGDGVYSSYGKWDSMVINWNDVDTNHNASTDPQKRQLLSCKRWQLSFYNNGYAENSTGNPSTFYQQFREKMVDNSVEEIVNPNEPQTSDQQFAEKMSSRGQSESAGKSAPSDHHNAV